MAINLKFDLTGNPEPPSIVLANRNGNKLGQLNVNVESIDVSDKFNAASEFSFTLNKYIDDKLTPLWDKVVDFKLVYCPEWDTWFEIKVELDEATETVKTVFCTQLGQAELSQIMLYNIEINTDVDIEREDFKTSILWDENNQDASILHRLLEKAPHYSIVYVDESIQRIQRQFSFDGTSICDAFNEIGEEIGCLFVYHSNSTKGGKPNRTISVYDLQQNCNSCGYRGEFTDKCPKCESTDIIYGYGEDTTIFVTSDELGSQGIQLVTDVDSVKNCFKLEAGDDLMTATIRNCNPNGSDYIWYFSDSMKEDMSDELVEGIESYDRKYQEYYNNHISELNEDLVSQYNALVEKYEDYYNTKSTCLDCGEEGYFEEQCSNSECNSKNILIGQKLQTIPTTIMGYPDLMTAYYNTIDLLLYLESGLMPNVQMSDTSAEEQLALLTTSSLSPVAVNVKDVENISETTAKSAVLSMAKILVRPTYKVDVVGDSSSLSEVDDEGEYKVWTGKFIVTNYSDEDDTATSDIISVRINNAIETFIEQKLEKALNKENTGDYSITGLFAEDYDEFCKQLKEYALNPLDNFSKVCDVCISILQEQGVGDNGDNEDDEFEKGEKKALYDKLYKPCLDKQQAINEEIEIRQSEIAIIEGVWDRSDENNPQCTTSGLQQYIEECQQDIQEELDFEKHLGEDLWLEFCAYRREDVYSNNNYVSDGLNNAELFERANEFIEVAEKEIFKSAELQHSISATLNNLLSLPKFKQLLKSFKTGNWIRVQIDDKVYKLRLLEYGFSYGDSENISVEFSDVTKIKNGITDVKEVLEQASSMASSYDSVQRQAEKGNVARSTIDQWLVDGLDSADVQIKNNDSEEILLTKSGLLARSYDDITGTYSPEQFKLTHNIMAYTDDGWETVSSALGKHDYKKWDGNNEHFVDDEGYGLTSKFVTAGYITGSQIIGGEIVSSNYKPKESGTHINLLNGNFDLAGGKIVYDTDSNGESTLTLKGVTIQWTGDDGVNAPEVKVENITGLDKYLDQLEDLEDQLDGKARSWYQTTDPSLTWDADEDHEGDLWYNSSSDSQITYIYDNGAWKQTSVPKELFDTIDGIASIYVTIPENPVQGDLLIPASDITVGSGETATTYKAGKAYRYNESSNESSWEEIKYTDDTRADDAYSLADSAKGIADNAKDIGDKLVNGLGFQETAITGEYIISPVIAGGHLLIGDTNGTYAQITTDGKLTCTNADVSGHINAVSLTLGEDTTIPYSKIGSDKPTKLSDFEDDLNIATTDYVKVESTTDETTGITTTTTTVGDNTYTTYTSDDANYLLTNLGVGTNFSPPEGQEGTYTQGFFKVEKNGLLTANNAMIWGTIYATNGEFTGNIKAGSTLYVGEHTDEDGNIYYNTWIDKDGVLNTIDANISGEIRATKGSIGGFTIEPTETDEGNSKSGGWLYSGELQEGQDSVQIGNNKSIFLSATDMQGNTNFFDETIDNWRLTVGNKFGVTSDGTTYMSDCEITGGSLKMGNVDDGYSAWISVDEGVLNANGVNISGTINAIEGAIAGWQITSDALYKKPSSVSSGMCAVGSHWDEDEDFIETEGLVYELNEDETGYIITDYTGTNTVVCIPSKYNSLPVLSISDRAFYGDNLTSITIPNSVTSIGVFAFYGCSLTSITIPDSVTSIGDYAFRNCKSLTSVTIGNSVTSTSIGSYVFANCTNLRNVAIPPSVWKIGSEIFSGCSNVVVYCGFDSLYSIGKDGWASNWNEGGSNIEFRWGCSSPYNCESLVWRDNISPPRFFAGSYSDVPHFVDDANFLVLEDGSLYAKNANISGIINATDGTFNGTITAIGGTFNDVDIQTGEISGWNFDGQELYRESDLNGASYRVLINSNMYTAENSIPYNPVFGVADTTNDSWDFKFFVRSNGELYASKADITGQIKCLGEQGGAMLTNGALYFNDYSHDITPINANVIFDSGGINFAAGGNIALGLFLQEDGSIAMGGTWVNMDGESVKFSDANLKNSIEIIDDRYDILFDNLISKRFKYNNGQSGRYHTGYIAQDVQKALKKAEITEEEFAAICTFKQGTDQEWSGLRYGEFVSLNTLQIQKLKKRVAELEDKLKVLEERM